MKPVLYEIKKTLTGKAMIVLFAFLVALPVVFAVSSARSTGETFNINSIGYGEGTNGTYNVSVFLYNGQYWTPIQGTNVGIFTGSNEIYGVTDASGFVNETLRNLTSSEADNVSYYYSLTTHGSTTIFESQIILDQGPSNPYFTPYTIQHFVNNKLGNYTLYQARLSLMALAVQNRPDIQTLGLSYNAQGLAGVPPLYVYYKPIFSDTSQTLYDSIEYSNITVGSKPVNVFNSSYLLNESQLTFFGEFQGAPFIPLNTMNLATNTKTTTYLFEIFSINGTELAFAVADLSSPQSSARTTSVFLSDELPLLGLFVPLMAILTGFTTFGRSKLDGSLNYVMVRTVSRWSLISSRFLSNIVAIFIPVAVSIGISSAVFHFYLGTYIPSSTIYLTLWSLLVMSAGFTGLVYLSSSMIRSLGRLVGIIMGVYLIFDLFWSFSGNLIPSLITSTLPYGSLKYATVNVMLDYVSPSGFANLVSYIGYGNTSQPFFLGNFLPSQVGITMVFIIGIGLLWILVPFLLSMVKFSKFD